MQAESSWERTDRGADEEGIEAGLVSRRRRVNGTPRRESASSGIRAKFFKDRITAIGGWRHDRNDRREVKNYIYEEGRDPEITSRVQDEAPTASSPQVGITFAINDSLSVFGLYSTGVVPNCTARDGIGDAFEPTKATNARPASSSMLGKAAFRARSARTRSSAKTRPSTFGGRQARARRR